MIKRPELKNCFISSENSMIRNNFMQKIILFTLADLHLLLKNNKRKPGEKSSTTCDIE